MQGDNQWGGQPSGQSGPYGPPGQPAAPSQPVYGYPGGPSQPMYGQPGPYSQPTQGYPGAQSVATMTPPRKGPPLWLWITIGGVVAVLILGGIGAFVALSLYGAPAAAATQFCTDLKTQNYDSAYNMLSAKFKAAYTSDQFHQANGVLDTAEGKVTTCGAASGSGAYDYSLGRSTATVTAVITRATQGSLQGKVQLVNESGGWTVDAMDTSLLGVNLSALQTLGAFCTALQSQSYSSVFGLLNSTLQTQVGTADIFAISLQLQDQVDGKVTACAIKAIPSGNTDTSTTVTVTVTRATLGAATGNISLEGTGSMWKISKIDQSVQGTNLDPLITGTLFCLALDANTYNVAYSLFSTGLQQSVTLAKFTADFTPPTGYKWGACTPNFTTYHVTGTQAQYSGTIALITPSGSTVSGKINFAFVEEGTAWKIDGVQIQ